MTSRLWSTGVRLVLTAVAGAGVVLATPSVAQAIDPVTPLVSCVTPVTNGYWTAVFGYKNNTSVRQYQRIGGDNDFDPDWFNGPQATTFETGTRHGVFTVRVPSSISGIQWELYDSRVTAYRNGSTACPPSTQLPAEGNGTGTAVALCTAGVVGAAVLYRFRRRSAVSVPPPSMG